MSPVVFHAGDHGDAGRRAAEALLEFVAEYRRWRFESPSKAMIATVWIPRPRGRSAFRNLHLDFVSGSSGGVHAGNSRRGA